MDVTENFSQRSTTSNESECTTNENIFILKDRIGESLLLGMLPEIMIR